MARPFFPFSALVEQNALKTALLLNAVDPTLGGVLIRGYKGTGKTTAVRSLARLLPEIEVVDGCPFNSDPAEPWEFAGVTVAGSQNSRPRATTRRPMPFVELPLNATEDRLVGTLQWERALKGGERYFDPGLLAAANRGLLYVDEVNLLDDHLVDLLLDAAASGVNLVEREGFSLSHPSRFILVGTMNPEEGELRPQFLDRFGLCAIVEHLADPLARELIVRRRLEFEADPDNFCRAWQDQEMALSEQVRQARRRLAAMALDQACLARLETAEHTSPARRRKGRSLPARPGDHRWLRDIRLEPIATIGGLIYSLRRCNHPFEREETPHVRRSRLLPRTLAAESLADRRRPDAKGRFQHRSHGGVRLG